MLNKPIPLGGRLYLRRGHDFACAIAFPREANTPLYHAIDQAAARVGTAPNPDPLALVWYGARWLIQRWDADLARGFELESGEARRALWATKCPDAAAALPGAYQGVLEALCGMEAPERFITPEHGWSVDQETQQPRILHVSPHRSRWDPPATCHMCAMAQDRSPREAHQRVQFPAVNPSLGPGIQSFLLCVECFEAHRDEIMAFAAENGLAYRERTP